MMDKLGRKKTSWISHDGFFPRYVAALRLKKVAEGYGSLSAFLAMIGLNSLSV
jgi:hypothetical protein